MIQKDISNCSNINSRVKQKLQPGFSFLEVMIVLILIAGIVGLAGTYLFPKFNEGNIKTAEIQMKLTAGTLETYYLDNASYPTTEQGLEALRGKPETGIIPKNWKGPYLKSDHPKDPWGNDFISNYKLGSRWFRRRRWR